MADLQTQRAEAVVHHLRAIRREENDVAVLRAGALDDRLDRFVVQVLDDRALQTVTALRDFVDLDPGQTLRAVDAHEFRVAVDIATRELARPSARAIAATRPSFVLAGVLNTLKSTSRTASVRSVNSSFTRRSGLSEPKRRMASEYSMTGNFSASDDADRFLEHVTDHRFEQIADFLFRQERGFAVDLREFRLTVGAQVFVAEALDDLVVAIEVRDHQHLLEQLRRLRQREELPGFVRDGTR